MSDKEKSKRKIAGRLVVVTTKTKIVDQAGKPLICNEFNNAVKMKTFMEKSELSMSEAYDLIENGEVGGKYTKTKIKDVLVDIFGEGNTAQVLEV